MIKYIENHIKNTISVKEQIWEDKELLNIIKACAESIINAYKNGKKVLIAGNGGSAGDAQHITAELVSKFMFDRPALNAIALTVNSSIMTAVGNDYSHEYVFSRQIQAYGNEGDVFIAISTSGNSKNIIKGIKEAKNRNLIVIGLTGAKKSKMDDICDYLIKVPSENTAIIQESHIMIGHIICALAEKELF